MNIVPKGGRGSQQNAKFFKVFNWNKEDKREETPMTDHVPNAAKRNLFKTRLLANICVSKMSILGRKGVGVRGWGSGLGVMG